MTLDEIKLTATPICSRHRVKRLDLFGSCARGTARPNSDLDFCVSFEDMPPSEYTRQFFGLLHELEDAFHSTIDLLTDTSIQKASLKKSIRTDGICVYG